MYQVLRSFSHLERSCRRLSIFGRHLSSRPEDKKMSTPNPTVGIIIIGDEILKGHVHDTNSHFLCRRLFSLGVKVKRVSVIPDELETIASEVRDFSGKFTHVITAGGIGPTHDDLTFEGVAKAFNEGVSPHPDLVAVCKEFFGTDDLKDPKLKLAFVPESAKLNYGINQQTGEKHKYPLVSVNNVYVFPGIPKLMERAFGMLEELFRNPDAQFHVREVYLRDDEMSVTEILNKVDAKYNDKVTIGSYPDFYNSYYKVKLTLEAEKSEYVQEVVDFLQEQLPKGCIVNYEKDPISAAADAVYDLAMSSESSSLVLNVRNAVQILEEAFDRYSLEEICVGFNGGKDCTALLHLTHAVFRKKFPDELHKLKALYIRRGQPFPEIELFIKKCRENYRLDLITVHGRIKEALGELIQDKPEIKACVMGTRRSDPYAASLEAFSPTDAGWPEMMRVNPMLDWSYTDVWGFLRYLNLPYCSLYDRGYTSLGSMENTHPNPSLQQVDSKGIISYQPAYKLLDSGSERDGRN